MKPRLIEYTLEIANRHSIPLTPHSVNGASFDIVRKRWETRSVNLPTNPYTSGPLLFVPHRFLRRLPSLNAFDWWDSYENEMLRDDINYEILKKVDKSTIVERARQNPELVRAWASAKEHEAAEPYDLNSDPFGVYKWDQATSSFVQNHPLTIASPATTADFFRVIDLVVSKFKLFVEEQGGWDLLWARYPSDEKPESAVQLLFRGIASHYCSANNISLDPEVNLGRGPVDFKFSSGYAQRAHLEVKKLENTKFWNGLERQLPSYMDSDEVHDGWFLVVKYRSGKRWDKRRSDVPLRVQQVSREKNLNIRCVIVDARQPMSASMQ